MNALYSLYDALISIHVPSDKARAVVDAMEHDMMTALATKSDLAAMQLLTKQQIDGLKQDIDGLRTELKQDIHGLRTELKQDIDGLRTELNQDIDALRTETKQSNDALASRTELHQSIDALHTTIKLEMELLRSSMTIRLGSMFVVGLGLLFAALKLT